MTNNRINAKILSQKNGIEFKSNHDINRLYNKSKIINDNFKQLIKYFKILDKTGTMLRYSTDQEDNEYRTKPLFIKAEDILKTTSDLTYYVLNKINNRQGCSECCKVQYSVEPINFGAYLFNEFIYIF